MPPLALRWHWETLSLDPTVSASAALEWLLLGALFLVVLLYPFGLVGEREPERRFYRNLVIAVLAVGAMLAAVGLLERAWWNGKLLWFYVPEDWGVPRLSPIPRVSGPFVNPDHFANYLAMVLPIGIVAACFPSTLVDRANRANLQLGAALASVIITLGLLLSFSRAGWAAAIVGIITAVAIAGGSRLVRQGELPVVQLVGIALLAIGASGLLLWAAGPTGRDQLLWRLQGLSGGGDFKYRPATWRDTLKMVRDLPFFGVGLGAWPDLFPHYQRAPWIPFFFRSAENDYLQFVSETGVVCFAALVWLSLMVGSLLVRGGRALHDRSRTLFAGLVGAVAAALFHAGFDFAFRTPANAVLFTILLAIALRLALTEGLAAQDPGIRIAVPTSRASLLLAPLGAVAALSLGCAIIWQDAAAYPYRVPAARDRAQAEVNLIAHPAMSAAHLRLAELIPTADDGRIRTALLHAAVWLDPNDPAARDGYAQALLIGGHQGAGYAQVTLSVYHAPRRGAHAYLTDALIPWLLPEEQTAIGTGFEDALQARFDGALDELVWFYGALGRYRDIAELYLRLAGASSDPVVRQTDLIEAGRNYGLAGDRVTAVQTLEHAAATAPRDPRPYAELARSVFGPAGDLTAAVQAIKTGLRAGAPAYPLYLAQADAAEQAHDRKAEEAALELALASRQSFELDGRLGELYLTTGQPEEAVRALTRAVAMRPGAADAWLMLARADEGVYDYEAAGEAYAHARALAPSDQNIRSAYASFLQRTAAAASSTSDPTHAADQPVIPVAR